MDQDNIILADGDVRVWVEQGDSVHIKAIDSHGDPVELSENDVKALADTLLRFYAAVRE